MAKSPDKTYLFEVTSKTPPVETIDPGAELEVVVEGGLDDVDDIATVPQPFTPDHHLELEHTASPSSRLTRRRHIICL